MVVKEYYGRDELAGIEGTVVAISGRKRPSFQGPRTLLHSVRIECFNENCELEKFIGLDHLHVESEENQFQSKNHREISFPEVGKVYKYRRSNGSVSFSVSTCANIFTSEDTEQKLKIKKILYDRREDLKQKELELKREQLRIEQQKREELQKEELRKEEIRLANERFWKEREQERLRKKKEEEERNCPIRQYEAQQAIARTNLLKEIEAIKSKRTNALICEEDVWKNFWDNASYKHVKALHRYRYGLFEMIDRLIDEYSKNPPSENIYEKIISEIHEEDRRIWRAEAKRERLIRELKTIGTFVGFFGGTIALFIALFIQIAEGSTIPTVEVNSNVSLCSK